MGADNELVKEAESANMNPKQPLYKHIMVLEERKPERIVIPENENDEP